MLDAINTDEELSNITLVDLTIEITQKDLQRKRTEKKMNRTSVCSGAPLNSPLYV